MKIELYEYGVDLQLKEAAKVLRGAIGKKISKADKDTKIGEAIGIIETIDMLIYINNDEEKNDELNESV